MTHYQTLASDLLIRSVWVTASEEIVGVGRHLFVNCDEMSLVVSVV
jgi:hypothetical protein